MNNNRFQPGRGMQGRGPRHLFREKPKDTKGALKRLVKYLGGFKTLIISLLFVILISTASSIASPVVQSKITNAIDLGQKETFIMLLYVLAVCYLLNIFCSLFRGLISAYLSQRTVLKIRKELFEKMVYLPISFFDNNPHGDIMSRMTNDVDSISSTISQSVASLLSTGMIILGACTVMILFSPLLACVAFLTVGLTLVFSRFMSSRMRKYFKIQQKMLGDINSKVEESISGQRTVSAYTREAAIEKDFNETSDLL